jgi:broad specificity phosphatase PhoE
MLSSVGSLAFSLVIARAPASRASLRMSAPAGVESLEQLYADIAKAQPAQQAKYEKWVQSGEADTAGLVDQAVAQGCTLDLTAGQMAYAPDFKPVPLCFDFIYCRHGKTPGNTEPRVFQGYVDEPNNALNDIGRQQAEEAADKLDGLGVSPDLIVLSSLSRASDTGMTWVRRHDGMDKITETWEDAAEMRFGSWDNMKVIDMDKNDFCHLFYLAQNVVVSAPGPYVRPSDGAKFEPESFVSMMTRMRGVLDKLNERMAPLAAEREAKGGPPPLVVMYGHSMAGAGLSVLTNNGKTVEGKTYLGFDGKYIMPNATPVYLHKCP